MNEDWTIPKVTFRTREGDKEEADDPYEESTPDNMIQYLEAHHDVKPLVLTDEVV
tara:strand:- start:30 stop:194 length:165 start_codon:yes stop_codon:yes gene_type:complete